MRTQPGVPVLWDSPGRTRIGTDPNNSTVVADLSPAEQKVLDALHWDPTVADLVQRGRMLGVDRERIETLIDQLCRLGVVINSKAHEYSLAPAVAGEYGAQARAGRPVMSARAAGVVHVHGVGRTGLLLALMLAASGLGTVIPHDDRAVRVSDVVPHDESDVGLGREVSAIRRLRAQVPSIRTSLPHRRRRGSHSTGAPVHVIVGERVVDPLITTRFMRGDTAHLLVTVREHGIAVGPLVIPGYSACLRCCDLARTDQMASWPAVATQARILAGPGEGAVQAAVAASLAAREMLAIVDGRPTTLMGASRVVAPTGMVAAAARWPMHPRCGCSTPGMGA